MLSPTMPFIGLVPLLSAWIGAAFGAAAGGVVGGLVGVLIHTVSLLVT